jgi:hypothetical protein
MPGRLYLVTRGDLPPGAQACQAAHAAIEFGFAFPEVTAAWRSVSSAIVLLAAADELALGRLHIDAAEAGLRTVAFYEPDFGGALTAVAIEPAGQRLLARLPLALPGSEP